MHAISLRLHGTPRFEWPNVFGRGLSAVAHAVFLLAEAFLWTMYQTIPPLFSLVCWRAKVSHSTARVILGSYLPARLFLVLVTEDAFYD